MNRFIIEAPVTLLNGDTPEKDVVYGWDHKKWLQAFQSADRDEKYRLRIDAFQSTVLFVSKGQYIQFLNGNPNTDDAVIRSIEGRSEVAWLGRPSDEKMRETSIASKFYSESFTPKFERRTSPAVVTVVPDDCLKAAKDWVDQGLDVCVLNLANRQHPGGGVERGTIAQEEYLFRVSNYYTGLFRFYKNAAKYGLHSAKEHYPLDRNYGGIYTPQVSIFRADEAHGYALLPKSWKADFIAVAAMRNPETVKVNGQIRIADSLVEGTRNKIRTIFRIAADKGKRNLILGALGCGAFHNPPGHMAELFRDVLCEQEFIGAFDRICFAVLADMNSNGNGNYREFYSVLNGFVPPMR